MSGAKKYACGGSQITWAVLILVALQFFATARAGTFTGTDIGSVGVAGTDTFNAATGVYTIAGSGSDIGGAADACHFVYQSLPADGELEARVASIQNTSSTAKAGVMIRQSTSAGAITSMIALEPSNSAVFLSRSSSGGTMSNAALGTAAAPYWVRVVKDSTLITVYLSSNGTDWAYEGLVRLSSLTNPVDIGFAVTSDNNTELCTATFDNITLSSQTSYAPTSPWQDQDVGTTGQLGQVHLESGLWSLYGAGSGLTGTADSFHFAYQALSGNGVILARVDGLSTSSASSGVVIRQNLTAGSAEAAVLLNSTSGINFVTRSTAGASVTSTAGASVTAPYWVKLVRAGNVFYGYESSDGATWTLVSNQTISLSGTVYVGVATTSSSTSTLSLGMLDRVAVVPIGNYLVNGDISSGAAHNLYLTTGGAVWSWGLNSNGQLGDGTTNQRNSPVPVTGLSNIEAISAGGLHSLALRNDGTVWVWGDNQYNQLGDGTTNQEASPEQLSTLSGMIAVSGGASHSVALKNDGTVWVWGNNDNGQLGDGTTISRPSPEQLTTLNGIVAISAGTNHTIALKSDGTVWAWGLNATGQLGDGTNYQRLSPYQVTGVSNIVAISAGTNHTMALDVDGNVWSWGDNSSGEIGNGTTTQSNSPVEITTLSAISAIKASNLFSLALSSAGTIYSWGNNEYGQLGNNTTTQENSPVAVSNITNAVAISAGYWHGAALASGSIYTWGNDSYGQLGNGNTTSSEVPVAINPGVPVINSPSSASTTNSANFSYTITATNIPTNFGATGLPSGLSINTQTGVISGTVATTGTYTISLSATNLSGTGTASLTLTVGLGSAPVISSSATASGNIGSAFTYTITASSNPTSFSATGLPAGLSLNSTSGVISGTPTAAGTSTVALGATNAAGTGTLALTITIKPAVPVITSATSATGITGSAFSYQITANNNPTSYSASGLPSGLSVNTSTGAISGTPSSTGTTTVTIGATNTGGTGNASLTITINSPTPVITSSSTATGTVGTAFSGYTITASNSPTSFSATGLPAGLSVNSSSGAITGTPTTAGSYPVKIGASNASGTGTATLTFTINSPTPVITSVTSALGNTGAAFSYTITASNNPTSYSATGLPGGLSVSTSTGKISGTPTATGTTSVTIGATNASGTGSATLTLTINPPTPVISSSTTSTGTISTAFSGYTITASNSPTSYSATGLPSGLTVNTSSGAISGTPTASGTFSVALGATNANGTGTLTLTLTIKPLAPVISSATTATATINVAFSGYSVTASNNPTSFSASGLPTGLSINTSTGAITGTPTTAGTSTVTLGATNSGGTGSASLIFTINQAKPVIYSPTTAAGTVGTTGTYTILATNSPTSYSATSLPAGLSVNTTTGVISGKPTTAGTSTVTLGATNASGTGSLTLTYKISSSAVPVISSATTDSGTTGTAISTYTITASNSPTSYSATGLPAGLSVNTTSGAITGTPTAVGISYVTLGATNANGTGTAILTFTIKAPIPVINSPTSATAVQGVAFSGYAITATNNPTSRGATGLPAGLSVNTTTGVISGTPTTAGTSSVSLSATNASGTGTATLSFTITPPLPVISSSTTGTATTGTAYSYTITASNSPTSFSASGLPAGLNINTASGAITGTPKIAGSFSITLGATNASGTGTATLALTINPPVPVITSATTATGVVGTAFSSYTITANNSPASFNATGLPAGLSVNTSTGAITGTPTSTGSSSVTLSATNANGTGTQNLTFTINNPTPVISSSNTAAGTTGTAFSYTITASNSPTSFSATGLPPGLTLNTSTGAITGTPTVARTSTVTLGASNPTGTGTLTLTLTVNLPTPVITSLTSAIGTTGSAFSYSITATNSPTSYSASGLPSGLTVSTSTGKITGTPSATGTSNVTIGATNASGTGSTTLTLTINPPTPAVTSSSTASGTTGSGFNYTITGSNSPTGYSATNLPIGLSLNSATGAITGTPTTAGTYSVTIGASNGSGSGTKTLSLTVSVPPPVISSSTTASGATGIAFTYTVGATNNPTSFNATGLPSGLSVNTSTGAISGTPTVGGTYSIGLSATNSGGTGTATLALTINLSAPVITSSLTETGIAGTNLNYFITASSTPTSFGATGLPPGLTVNSTTGAIVGAPSTSGTYNIQLSAANSAGVGYATLTLTVGAAPTSLPVTSGLTAWFEANAGVTAQAGSVSQWNDQTTNQYNVSQNGYAPGIGQDAASGLPVVTFNGNQLLTNSTQITGLDDTTIITVASTTTPTTNFQTQVVVGALYDNNGARIFVDDNGNEGFDNSSTTVDGGPVPNNTNLNISTVTFSDSGGTATFYSQGLANGSASITATSLAAGLTLGSVSYTPYQGWNGNIAEVIVYNRVLSTAERQSVEGYLADKYNIYAPGAAWIANYPTNIQTLINQNDWSQAQTIQYLQSINPVPVITSATTATGFVGGTFNYTITGSNSPTYFEASGLPAGLSLNSTTGVISGTPTIAGTYSVTLSAVNVNGAGQLPMTITVQPAIPVITSSLVAGGTQNIPFSYTITAGSGATTFGASGLPTGLSVNTSTGVISGTPTTTGTSTVTITATNINGTGNATLDLTVYGPLPVTSGLAAWYSAEGGVTLSGGGVTQWNDQTGQYNLTQSAGSSAPATATDPTTGLPVIQFNGNQFLSNSSQVSGVNDVTIITVASAATSGESGVQVQVGATWGSAATRGLAYVGGDVAFTNGIDNSGYFTSVSGGPAVQGTGLTLNSLTYSASSSLASFFSNGMPNGTATLSTVATASGLIVGDAITYGNYYNWDGNIAEIVIYNRVLSNTERQEVENYLASKYSIPPIINSSTSATATTGSAFNYTVTASDSPTGFSATGLPTGLSINTSTGLISGTPSVTGTFYVTTTAFNAGGSSSQTLTLTVWAPVAPTITSPTIAAAVVGQPFNYSITANNNPATFNASGLPAALSVNTATGVISGTPSTAGTSTVSLSSTNTYGTGTASLQLTVYPSLPVTSGLTAWLNADVGVTTAGGSVTQWNDQSGNSNNVTQSAGANAPTVGTDTSTGNAVVSFNANQYLNNSSSQLGTGDVTIVTVSSMQRSTNSATSVVVGNAYSSSSARAMYDDNGNQSYDDGTNIVDGGALSGNGLLNVSTVTYSQSSSLASFYNQGSANGTASVSSSSINAGFTVGSLLNYTPWSAWNGNIAEVIVYNRVLSTTERQEVESYLANKYSLYIPGASWISSYTSAVQTEINRNHWNKNQADAYVTFQNANSGMLTTGLVSWLRADSGVETNGSVVNQWNDQTGNYSVVSPSGNQPTLVTNDLNGKPAVRFNGSQWLYNGSNVWQNQDMTMIAMVAPSGTTTSYQSMVFLGNQQYPTCRSLVYNGGQQMFDASYDGVSAGTEPSPQQFVMQAATLASDLATVSFYQNGVASGTGTLSPALSNMTPGVTIGGVTNGNVLSQCFQGDIAEVLVYDHQLSSTEMQQVSLYLSGKYGFYYPGASWISTFTSTVQAEINRNQWSITQANAYVAMQSANPSMLTNGLKLWLKADSGVTTGIGSYVKGWTDQTGSYPVSQNSVLGQPQLIPNDSNGEPALRFSGSQSLTNVSGLGSGASADMTIVTVGMTTAPSSSEYSFYSGSGATGGSRAVGYNGSEEYFDTAGNTASGAASPSQGVFAIETASINSSLNTVTFYRDGTQTASQSISNVSSPTSGIAVGGGAGGNSAYWKGDISEVLVYDHQLSSSELQQLGLYLANKYGIYYPGASWISSYSSAIQTQINANQWNEAQANQYAQISSVLPVPSGLISWYRTNSGLITNTQGQVTSWLDSGMAGNNITQVTPANRPTAANDPVTGTPTVNFTTSQSLTQNSGYPTVTASSVSDCTIIAVASTSAASSMSYSPLVQYGTSVNNLSLTSLLYHYSGSSLYQMFYDGYFYYTQGGTVSSTANLTTSAVTYTHSSGALSFYLNGTANGTATAGGTGQFSENVTLGGTLGGTAWQGNISEVLIYNRVLSSTEIQQIQTYINAKYPSAAPPTISPNGGNITTSTSITLSGATTPNVIRYTLDGTIPSGTSTQYSSPFTLSTDGQVVNAAIFSGTTQVSQIASAQFWIGDTYHIGIPDAWQTEYLGSVTDLNPSASVPGGSGLTYLQAYQWGYNPNMYSTNGDGLSDLVNHQLGYAATDTDINGYTDASGNPMTNAQQLALGLDPFDAGVNPPQPTPPSPNPNDHTPPPINLTQPSNATLLP